MKEEKNEDYVSKRVCAVEVLKWVREIKLVAIASLILLFLSTGLLYISDWLPLLVIGLGSGILMYYIYKANTFEKYLRDKYGV